MPQYLYIDQFRHHVTLTARMGYTTGVICATCGAEMWRKPQAVSVTWGGLRPSQGELSHEIQDHIRDVDRKRDRYEDKHGDHD